MLSFIMGSNVGVIRPNRTLNYVLKTKNGKSEITFSTQCKSQGFLSIYYVNRMTIIPVPFAFQFCINQIKQTQYWLYLNFNLFNFQFLFLHNMYRIERNRETEQQNRFYYLTIFINNDNLNKFSSDLIKSNILSLYKCFINLTT